MIDEFLCATGNEKRTTEVKSSRELITYSEPKLDLRLLRKHSSAKTSSGIVLGYLKKLKNIPLEYKIMLQEMYKEIKRLETSERIILKSWRGKSGIKLIEEPDKFICITHKRADKGESPKEIKKEILKEDLNKLIVVLNSFEDKNKIPTSEIGEKYYHKDWQSYIYGHRDYHISLTYMLNILEQKGYTIYSRKGFTKVLSQMKLF